MNEVESSPANNATQKKHGAKKVLRSFASWLGSFVSFLLILAVIAGVYISQNPDKTYTIFGHSAYLVLTTSMQSEIPQESFVLVKDIEPNVIEVGDNITFVRSDNKNVTHQVVDIYEDYMESGMRGFKTKGVDNYSTDREIVYADNVVGLVVFHSAEIGMFITWLKGRVWFAVAFIAVLVALLGVLGHIRNQKEKKENNAPASGKVDEEDKSQKPLIMESTDRMSGEIGDL